MLQGADEQLYRQRCAYVCGLPTASRRHGCQHTEEYRDEHEGQLIITFYFLTERRGRHLPPLTGRNEKLFSLRFTFTKKMLRELDNKHESKSFLVWRYSVKTSNNKISPHYDCLFRRGRLTFYFK